MITNAALLRSLQELHAKVDILMSQQDDLTAAATAIQAENADLATAAANISAEIAALKAANPSLDLSGLDAAVAGIPRRTGWCRRARNPSRAVTMTTPLPGDYACVSIGGNGGTLIGLGEKLAGDKFTQYQHAFIYVGDGQIIEAEPSGARKVPLARYGKILWSTGKIPLSDVDRRAICAVATSYIGTGYSWLDYAAIALHARHIWAPWLKTYIASTKSMICSQLVDQCYQDAGVHLFQDGRWPGYVTPADLAGLIQP